MSLPSAVIESPQRSLFPADQLPGGQMPWEQAAEADQLSAGVVFGRPVDTVFHYLVPDELREMIAPGQRVRAPFGKGGRLTVGYCVSLGNPPATARSLKLVVEILDREPIVPPRMLELTRWIADRYLCSWGQVLETVIPAGVKRKAGTRVVSFFRPVPGVCERLDALDLPAKQRAVLDVLCASDRPMRIDELTEAAACGTAPINGLRDKRLIEAIRDRTETFEADDVAAERVPDLVLNAEQQEGLDTILSVLRSGRHETILLHGVTGSGKTEVYIQAIREIVGYGRQAIVLVPEISLTPQTIRRFRSRFPSVAVLHSHLSDAERHWHWQRIARGEVQVVVGARSAVFAPTPHLGLIVIDEEHETTFKQEMTPRYHAREVARQQASMEGIPLVLGSATPTLESWLRVQQQKDRIISLPRRVEGLPLPPVVVVDVRNDPRISQGFAIGRALETAMHRALADGGQVILLLNLRGYSTALWCRSCGETVKCPNCDITLTWHRDRAIVLCHSCEFDAPPPPKCPHCGHPSMRYVGVGTQKLEEEVLGRFPEAAVLRMDSDSMRKPGSHDAALEAFRRGEVQILLGTQMIAKGLDFPNVTLVGVVGADALLHQPDLRASERTFQLIAQVAGRTGRSTRGGRVFVQTTCPADPAILKASEHDYVGFVTSELAHRREMLAPPYYHFARVILRGAEEPVVRQQARDTAAQIREAIQQGGLPVRLMGPAPAIVSKLKGQYRYHFQMVCEDLGPIQHLWRSVADALPHARGVEQTIDVDPIDLR